MNYMPFIFMFTHAWSLHFPLKKKGNKKKTKENKKGHTTFFVTCVGYHDNGYKPTMLGLYTHLSKKKLKIM